MAFVGIGIFEVRARHMPDVVALFRDQVTPIFAAHDGFLGYQALTDVDSGRYVGLSYWTTLAALEASNPAARRAREAAVTLGARTLGEPLITREAFDTRPARQR
jgi:heme-degrading monooxygenase HmoA